MACSSGFVVAPFGFCWAVFDAEVFFLDSDSCDWAGVDVFTGDKVAVFEGGSRSRECCYEEKKGQ